MIYLLAAVVFYTVVRHGVQVWEELRYEAREERHFIDRLQQDENLYEEIEKLKKEMKNKTDKFVPLSQSVTGDGGKPGLSVNAADLDAKTDQITDEDKK